MDNKVIINLDEYLYMRDCIEKNAKLLSMLSDNLHVKEDHGVCLDPLRGGHSYDERIVEIGEFHLKKFINQLLDLNGTYDIKIVKENEVK